jgi:hypothetical protein
VHLCGLHIRACLHQLEERDNARARQKCKATLEKEEFFFCVLLANQGQVCRSHLLALFLPLCALDFGQTLVWVNYYIASPPKRGKGGGRECREIAQSESAFMHCVQAQIRRAPSSLLHLRSLCVCFLCALQPWSEEKVQSNKYERRACKQSIGGLGHTLAVYE